LLNPTWQALRCFSVAEQAARMNDPLMKARILGNETKEMATNLTIGGRFITAYDQMYELSDPPNYEPDPEWSIGAQSRRTGRSSEDIVYDVLIRNEGRQLIYVPITNYGTGSL